jgi:hypothetical protein
MFQTTNQILVGYPQKSPIYGIVLPTSYAAHFRTSSLALRCSAADP